MPMNYWCFDMYVFPANITVQNCLEIEFIKVDNMCNVQSKLLRFSIRLFRRRSDTLYKFLSAHIPAAQLTRAPFLSLLLSIVSFSLFSIIIVIFRLNDIQEQLIVFLPFFFSLSLARFSLRLACQCLYVFFPLLWVQRIEYNGNCIVMSLILHWHLHHVFVSISRQSIVG